MASDKYYDRDAVSEILATLARARLGTPASNAPQWGDDAMVEVCVLSLERLLPLLQDLGDWDSVHKIERGLGLLPKRWVEYLAMPK